jgi:hypothetical protein
MNLYYENSLPYVIITVLSVIALRLIYLLCVKLNKKGKRM